MTRAWMAACLLAALPAAGFDLEKFMDKQAKEFFADARRERIEALAHGEPDERLEAAKSLGGDRDPAAIAALGSALADRDARVRQAAASGLWRIEKAAEPARAQLVAALGDPDPNVLARVAGALQSLGMKQAELVAPRKRVLASPEATTSSRFLVARNLVGAEPPVKLLEPMLAFLADSARGYTGSVGDKHRHNVELAQSALERLVKRTKDRALIAPLMEELPTAGAGACVLAKALGLYKPRPEGFARALAGLLDSPHAQVRYAALGQMRSLTAEADVRTWAPRASALLQDPESSVRVEALWALGAAGGLAAAEVDKVVAALSDPDASVRRAAARALGEMGEARQAVTAAAKARVGAAAREPLALAEARDPDKDVRDEARGALRKFGGGGAPSGTVAAAAPAPGPAPPAASAGRGSESAGMAVLRARKVSFEEGSFFRALTQVDVELVRAFLDAGMSPRADVAQMGSPMRAMLFAGRACNPGERPTKPATKEIVRMLLERGADVNAADANGNTPLMEAASKGCDRELIRTLIKAGAKINAKNRAGLTPFEMGLWMGHDGLEELIAAGYRLPPAKVKTYTEGYKGRPAALSMIRKAAR